MIHYCLIETVMNHYLIHKSRHKINVKLNQWIKNVHRWHDECYDYQSKPSIDAKKIIRIQPLDGVRRKS